MRLQLRFERTDLTAQRRLGYVQEVGSPANTIELGNLHEVPELLYLHGAITRISSGLVPRIQRQCTARDQIDKIDTDATAESNPIWPPEPSARATFAPLRCLAPAVPRSWVVNSTICASPVAPTG